MDRDIEEKLDKLKWLAWSVVMAGSLLIVMMLVATILPISMLVVIVPGLVAFSLCLVYLSRAWPIQSEHEKRIEHERWMRERMHSRAMGELINSRKRH